MARALRCADVLSLTKICCACKENKPIEAYAIKTRFRENGTSYKAPASKCRVCQAARRAFLRIPKKDEINAKIRARRAADPVRTKKLKAKWYANMKAKQKLSVGILRCTKCKNEKSVSEFYKNCSTSTGYQYSCKQCAQSIWQEKYYGDKGFREKAIGYASKRNRVKKYGITDEMYNHILKAQDNKCAICRIILDKSKFSLIGQMDHCHTTGKARGILCGACNVSLGGFRDREDILLEAVKYLSKYREGQ